MTIADPVWFFSEGPLKDMPLDIAEAAYRIVSRGGQILLPFRVGDAKVNFDSRWKLALEIAEALLRERHDALT